MLAPGPWETVDIRDFARDKTPLRRRTPFGGVPHGDAADVVDAAIPRRWPDGRGPVIYLIPLRGRR